MTDRTPTPTPDSPTASPGAPVGPTAARTATPADGIRRITDPLSARCRGGILLRSSGPPVSPAEPQCRRPAAAGRVGGDEAARAA